MEITRYVRWQSIDADMTRSRSDRCPSACWKPAQPGCWLAWMLEAGPAESPDVGPAGIGNSPLGSVHAGRPGSGIRPTRVWVCRQAGLARPDSAQADIFGFFLICLRTYCYFFPLATLINLQSWVPGIVSPTASELEWRYRIVSPIVACQSDVIHCRKITTIPSPDNIIL